MTTRRQKNVDFLGRLINRVSQHGKLEYDNAVLIMGWKDADKAIVRTHDQNEGSLGPEAVLSMARNNLVKISFGGAADPILVSPIPSAVFAILYA